MKISRILMAALALSLFAITSFGQTNDDAKTALLKWKEKTGAEKAGTYQAVGFSVDPADVGVTAAFYFEAGPNVTGPGISAFIAQPVMMVKNKDGKTVPVEIGGPSRISSEGVMLEKGMALEDRSGMSKITLLMPEKATALRLSVKNILGETVGTIFLGVGSAGVIGSGVIASVE